MGIENKKEIRFLVSEDNLNKIKAEAKKSDIPVASFCKLKLFEKIIKENQEEN